MIWALDKDMDAKIKKIVSDPDPIILIKIFPLHNSPFLIEHYREVLADFEYSAVINPEINCTSVSTRLLILSVLKDVPVVH